MVDIQAARAADAAARTHCPAPAHQTAISPKARVISEKRTTIGTRPMLLLVLFAVRGVGVVARSAHAAGEASGAPIQSSRQQRGVAQLVEHRSPKPGVAGSSPVAPVPLFKPKPAQIQRVLV